MEIGIVPNAKIYQTLSYAGGLPFLACALAPYAGITELGPLGVWDRVLVMYGLAIASFLAGTHWAFELARPGAHAVSLFIVSNVLVLAVWLAALVAVPAIALGVQGIVFLVLLRVDSAVAAADGTPPGYLATRRRITFIVLAALAIGISATWLA